MVRRRERLDKKSTSNDKVPQTGRSARKSEVSTPRAIPPTDNERRIEYSGQGNGPGGHDDDDDDLDSAEFDPNAVDAFGDFGLDDEEAVPDEDDFWFDDADRHDD
jgi:hypothetical protein